MLTEMRSDIEGPYRELAKVDAVRQVMTMKALSRARHGERGMQGQLVNKVQCVTYIDVKGIQLGLYGISVQYIILCTGT